MSSERRAVRRHRDAEALDALADVLVIGGGPAGAWAAVAAAEAGSRVILVDKGYLGTSGATAPSNTGTWFVPPGEGRRAAIEQRQPRTGGLADPRWVERTLDTAWEKLHCLAAWGYPFPDDDEGRPYLANLRGPDYMHFMRRRVLTAGVTILDHHPALELLGDGETIAGAAGIDRQRNRSWRVRAGAVVLATGGCAFGERILGAAALTGDGYLMAAEAGAVLSGMEFSAQFAFTPKPSALNKGLPFHWASFTRQDGTPISTAGRDRHAAVAEALLEGPVFAQYDKAAPEVRPWLRQGQPNCFLPLDRNGIDPFTERWPVTLRCEGTVRGVGGIRLLDDDCATGVLGLYAAGDAATRERITGAISGGGGPNSSWAIASGNWAGRAAARFAARVGARIADRPVTPLGQAGLRPAGTAREDCDAQEIARTVREEMLPLDRNFFRREVTLRRSLDRLDACWADLQHHGPGDGLAAVKVREAAALTATSRWAYRSALARAETRGMHRRLDWPGADWFCLLAPRERIGSGAGRPRRRCDDGGRVMIEIVSAGRCIACDICVKVCPANVFDAMPEGVPVIARQADCQTCFLCEIYCPTDALYVAPDAEGPTAVNEADIEAAGLFGSYARALGWRRGKPGGAENDPTFRLRAAD